MFKLTLQIGKGFKLTITVTAAVVILILSVFA